MSVDIGTVLDETVDRLLTPAGAVLAVLFSITGILQSIGIQDLMLAWVQQIVTSTAQSDPQAAADLEQQMETAAGQGLSFGLGVAPAAVVLLLGFVGGLVVLVLAIDAFGRGKTDPNSLGTDGIAWKVGNLLIGWIIWSVFVFGFWWFIGIPLVFGVLTMFFPVAIVLDGKSFVGAYADSVGFVRDNVVTSVIVAVLGLALPIAVGIVGTIFAVVPVVGPILGTVVSAAAWTLLWAVVTTTYVSGADTAAGTASTDSASQPGQAI